MGEVINLYYEPERLVASGGAMRRRRAARRL